MIKEITIGKKYKVRNADYTRTPLFIYNECLFYEHDYNGFASCAHCCIEDFMKDVEEIPEEKEKYFQIYYKAKSNFKPYATTSLFTSKEEFLQYTGIREENLEFFHMKEVENQLEKV